MVLKKTRLDYLNILILQVITTAVSIFYNTNVAMTDITVVKVKRFTLDLENIFYL